MTDAERLQTNYVDLQALADCRREVERLREERDAWRERYAALQQVALETERLREENDEIRDSWANAVARLHGELKRLREALERIKNLDEVEPVSAGIASDALHPDVSKDERVARSQADVHKEGQDFE